MIIPSQNALQAQKFPADKIRDPCDSYNCGFSADFLPDFYFGECRFPPLVLSILPFGSLFFTSCSKIGREIQVLQIKNLSYL